jgi:beta-glucanase (GH16 family)
MDAPYTDKPTFGGGGGRPGLVWPIGKLKEHKYLKKYGYFECRCKLQKKAGWWSAFWLQSPVIGSSLDPSFSGIENDIMESFEPGKIDVHVNHYNGYGADHRSATAGHGKQLSLDEYHTFGMLWEEDGYTFFIDGVQNGRKITEVVSHADTFVLIGTEPNGYRGYIPGHVKDNPHYKIVENDEFIVDYVRVFDKMK